jgi:hypothetical protein
MTLCHTSTDKIIYELTCNGRFKKAQKNGRMQYRCYNLKLWQDGSWHIYAPFTNHCIDEAVLLSQAIQIIEDDIRNQA